MLQPRFIPRLAITVDWFDIKVDDAIQGIGAGHHPGDLRRHRSIRPSAASSIATPSGSLWRTVDGFVERSRSSTSARSRPAASTSAPATRMELGGLGGLSFNFVGTWLDELITDNGISDPLMTASASTAPTCGTPNPGMAAQAPPELTHPDGYRPVGPVALLLGVGRRRRMLSTEPDAEPARLSQPFNRRRIPAQSYIDLALTARIGDHYNFRLGVNNIFDRDPPIIGASGTRSSTPARAFCNGNTYPQVYDALGRYIFAGVTLDF